MEGDFIKINEWLQPLSWFYGFGVKFRNFLFDVEILKSRSYAVPVISIGNITVGGTGKTPHVEYLIRLLKDKMRVAVLSRGYKRKSSGYILADNDTPMRMIGDEPFQMKEKFPNITVAVDKKRTRGIDRLTADKAIDVVLLDDAFQHRYVKPGINILLVDYHRLIIYDKLLPAGRLRESQKGKDRADVVLVTKCPADLKPMEFRVITKALNLYPYQHLFFTTLHYPPVRPLFPNICAAAAPQLSEQNVLLLSGIASPRQLIEDLTPQVKTIKPMTFADHHNFSSKDIHHINEAFDAMPQPAIIITTEKDAVRLKDNDHLSQQVRCHLYVQPISIRFMLGQEAEFNNFIIGYIKKNSKNNILIKGKDDVKQADVKDAKDNTSSTKPKKISFR